MEILDKYNWGFVACSSNNQDNKQEPEPPKPPKKVTQSGTITDVLDNNAISGAGVECSEDSDTTETDGKYTIEFTEGTTPLITITHNSHVTRQTFPNYGPDYSIIPNSFDMVEFDTICRHLSSGTERWPLDPTKKPIVWISTSTPTQNNTPQYFKDLVRDIVNNDIPLITKNVLTDLLIQEGPYAAAPSRDVMIVNYQHTQGAPGTTIDTDSNNVIYYTRTDISVLDVNGEVMIVQREWVIHELGHAIGFQWITDNRNSIMFRSPGVGYSPAHPTQLDIDNGTVLYSRPTMNKSPDNDPTPSGSTFTFQTYEQAVHEYDQNNPSLSDPFRLRPFQRQLNKPRNWLDYEKEMLGIRNRQQGELEKYNRMHYNRDKHEQNWNKTINQQHKNAAEQNLRKKQNR